MRQPALKYRLLWLVGILGVLAAVNGYSSSEEPAGEAKSKEHGGGAPKHEGEAAKGAAEGERGAPAAESYRLGPSLDGRFDVTTLRGAARVTHYRFPIKGIKQSIASPAHSWQIYLSCVIEFGSESGVAEIQRDETAATNDLRELIMDSSPERLLTVEGKYRLKEEIARALNRRLSTARVRQVYLTDFWMLKI